MHRDLVREIALLLSGAPDADPVQAEAEAWRIVSSTGGPNHPDRARALEVARHRIDGKPLCQLLGETVFMGLSLIAEPGVFAVRKETEMLGRAAIDILKKAGNGGKEVCFIDVGCGTGNLTCAIANAIDTARGYSSDISTTSADLTRRNVERTGAASRVKVFQGDLFAPLEQEGLQGQVDLVVCNPPYIATTRLETDRAHLLAHEPRAAFDGGPYGLSVHQRLIKEAPAFLRPGGYLLFEFGIGQERQVKILFERSRMYDSIDFVRDDEGEARVGIGRKKSLEN